MYRAQIDPFASLSELNEEMCRLLYREIRNVAVESYRAQGLTRKNGGTFRNVSGDRGQFEFQLQCYGCNYSFHGDRVIQEPNGPHKRTIWYTERQLFKPRSERIQEESETDSKPVVESTSDSPGEFKTLQDMRLNGFAFTKSREMIIDDIVMEGDPAQTENVVGKSETASSSLHSRVTFEGEVNDNVATLISGLVDDNWKSVLSDAIRSESFQRLACFLDDERARGVTIYPPSKDIFAALNLCPLDTVKVVIVGQDPYHGPGQGHGLAFSVRRGVEPPPSLKNIIREAIDDVEIDRPGHGNLEHWAKQGVLLLNSVLTVRRGLANSHAKQGWEEFTDAVIDVLNTRKNGLVFLLWGTPAAKKGKAIDESLHTVIRTSHPSPLGATKTASPFLGSRCFSRANEALVNSGKSSIDWSIV